MSASRVLELGQRSPAHLGVAWTGPGASVSFSFLWKVMDKESPCPSSPCFTLSSIYLCLLPVGFGADSTMAP